MQGYLHALLLPKTQYMIRSFTKVLSLVLLAAATFSACKKDKDDSMAVTKENLAGTYTLSSAKMKATNVAETDITNDIKQACEKDDEYVLKTDMSFAYNDVGTKCTGTNSYTDTWELQDKSIAFDDFYGNVKTLTSKELVIELTMTVNNVTATETFYFAKK
jgi:hypothetical protein